MKKYVLLVVFFLFGFVCNSNVALASTNWINASSSINWNNAMLYCQTFGADWRVPTLPEVQQGLTGQFIDGNGTTYFISDSYYWSSSLDGTTAGTGIAESIEEEPYFSVSYVYWAKTANKKLNCISISPNTSTSSSLTSTLEGFTYGEIMISFLLILIFTLMFVCVVTSIIYNNKNK